MPPPPQPAWYAGDDLSGFEAWCWAQIARGVADRKSALHTPTLCTIGLDGAPRARVLVLRGADRAGASLRLHTDRRSAKVEELNVEPRVSVLFYDATLKLQLRVSGTAVVGTEDHATEEAWAATRPFSRECYRVAPPPGTAIVSGGSYAHPGDDTNARASFATIRIAVETLEALYLAASGHRRARFGSKATWLVP